MSFPSLKLYLVSVDILPQKEGVDLPRFVQKLANLLADYSTATRVVYKFKVSGESKILSVIQVSNIIGLERTLSGLSRLGAVEVSCVPLLTYENFSRYLKVSDHVLKPNPNALAKEGLYWVEFDVGHQGKSTDELLSLWRKEAEAALTARLKEGTSMELYKSVGSRKVHLFINAADPEQIDLLSFQLPIMHENGANVTVKCRAVQFLEDYVGRITAESI